MEIRKGERQFLCLLKLVTLNHMRNKTLKLRSQTQKKSINNYNNNPYIFLIFHIDMIKQIVKTNAFIYSDF